MAVPEKVEDKYKEDDNFRYDTNSVLDAVIDENNLPRCPKCNEVLDWRIDHKFVNINGINYNQFFRKCPKCRSVVQYCIDTKIEKRYSFDKNEIKNIKITVDNNI